MANFWTTFDAEASVNVLGFRVRVDETDPGPADPGGYHRCPRPGDPVIPVEFAPLRGGDGYRTATSFRPVVQSLANCHARHLHHPPTHTLTTQSFSLDIYII